MQHKQREELAEKLVESMGVIMRLSGAVFREELEKLGATFPQAHLLKIVSFHEGMTVTELSQLMMVAAPTASRMIENLCGKGLLTREKDTHDQRVTRVKLTRKGREVLKKMDKLQVSVILDMLEGEDLQELETFTDFFDKLTSRWSETSGRVG
jgi:DNA-binding MarR family transcriptional regulator